MKKNFFVFLISMSLLSGCGKGIPGENGWYSLSEGTELRGKPLFSVKDITEIEVDSVYMDTENRFAYGLSGSFNPKIAGRFVDYIQQNEGKMIAFVYNGQIISRPLIQQGIHDGRFIIISLPLFFDREYVFTLYRNIRKESGY